MAGLYNVVAPGLRALKILWPTQPRNNSLPITTIIVNAQIEYDVQVLATTAAIIEWNIGLPWSSQIRQTSADRTDFAY